MAVHRSHIVRFVEPRQHRLGVAVESLQAGLREALKGGERLGQHLLCVALLLCQRQLAASSSSRDSRGLRKGSDRPQCCRRRSAERSAVRSVRQTVSTSLLLLWRRSLQYVEQLVLVRQLVDQASVSRLCGRQRSLAHQLLHLLRRLASASGDAVLDRLVHAAQYGRDALFVCRREVRLCEHVGSVLVLLSLHELRKDAEPIEQRAEEGRVHFVAQQVQIATRLQIDLIEGRRQIVRRVGVAELAYCSGSQEHKERARWST